MEQKIVNRLPSKTWNWLKVNEAVLDWDNDRTTDLGAGFFAAGGEENEPIRVEIEGKGEYSYKAVNVTAKAGSCVTVYEIFRAEANLAVETRLTVRENATVRLIQVQATQPGSVLYNSVKGECADGGRIELTQVLVGRGDVYCDSGVELNGRQSGLKAAIGYLGRESQKLDMNLVVNHWGKNTESEIDASGALRDEAKKIFRGTIDFKRGSSDSVGNEKETVLMLGENVVNKTVPLILCAEENVVGNHGATIGEMDDETLFYFESRGVDRETAENMLARAAIERLAREIGDERTKRVILSELDGETEDDE